jgi:Transposase DDE domain group 1
LLTRPVGRPPKKPVVWFTSLHYQAKGWTRARRVVAKVEWHQGELYPRVGFIVTNLKSPAERVVNFYNGRGTAEQWIRERRAPLDAAVVPRLPGRRSPAATALAYDLANFLRTLALPDAVAQWSLTTLRGARGSCATAVT